MRRIGLLLLACSLSACGVKQNGNRTLTFGSDGITVTSESVAVNGKYLADIEKEKTRQICYSNYNTLSAKTLTALMDNPTALAMWEQSKALNNALSLLAIGKQYDPCPSSTNSSDVEIADAKMYESIYGKAFSFGKFGLGVFGATKIFGDLFGAMGAGGYAFNLTGDGNSMNVSDSFKRSFVGNNSTTGGIFSTESHEEVVFEPEG